MAKRLQLRGDIASSWESVNPILASREIGIQISNDPKEFNFKIGTGKHTWNELPFYNSYINETNYITEDHLLNIIDRIKSELKDKDYKVPSLNEIVSALKVDWEFIQKIRPPASFGGGKNISSNLFDNYYTKEELDNHIDDSDIHYPQSAIDITEDNIILSDVNTNNVTINRHGFAPKLPNDPSLFLNGQGSYVTPTGLGFVNHYIKQQYLNETSVNVIHDFGTEPLVQILDDDGEVIIPLSIKHNSINDFTVTFSSETSGFILASLGSPQLPSFKSVSEDYTVEMDDEVISVTESGVIISLITANGNLSKRYVIDNASIGDITIEAFGSETINNLNEQKIPSNNSVTIISNGYNWRII
ncbi:MAG: hypothetical protein ACOCZ5_00030 [bacterium]